MHLQVRWIVLIVGAAILPGSRVLAISASSIFAREEVYEALAGVHDIVAGDFNGDAMLDLAVTNSHTEFNGSLGLTVYYKESGGIFGGRQDYTTSYRPFGAAAADFNDDGIGDVAVATYYAKEIAVRYGVFGGGLSAAVNYPVSGQPWSVAIGDFLGDSRLDIATNHYQISLLEGVSGGFAPAQPVNTGTFGYGNLISADVNKDGRLDLLLTTGSSEHVQLLPGQPSGGFGASQVYYSGPGSDGIAAGDLNGDGWLDLAIGNWSLRMVRTLMGQPGGGFSPGEEYSLPRYPRALKLADLNYDGHLDLAVTATENSSGFLSILLNSGDGSLAPSESIPIHGEGEGLVVADFDGNGAVDLAVTASATGSYHWSFSVFYSRIPEPCSTQLVAAATAILLIRLRRKVTL